MFFQQSKTVMNLLFLFITGPTIAEKSSQFHHTLLGEDEITEVLSFGESCTIHTIAPSVTIKELSMLVKVVASKKNASPIEIVKELEMKLQQRRPLPPYFQFPPSNQSTIASFSHSTVVKKNDTLDELWKLVHASGLRSRPPINIIPPPDASISIFKENIYNPVRPSISFSVTPMMNFFEVLHQISRQNQDGELVMIKVKQTPLGHCLTIDKIENLQQNSQNIWDIIIMDKENKLMRHSPCIPSPEDFFILPGTRIYLIYKRKI